MVPWTLDQLDARAADVDALVDASPLVDRFCASTAWVIPAFRAFAAPDAEARVLAGPEGVALLQEADTALGRTWMPLEAAWGLAAPFVGPDLGTLATDFVHATSSVPRAWDALFLSGLRRGAPDFNALVRRLGTRHRLGLGQPTVRCVASLDGGFDGFLARRPASFRKALRNARNRARGRVRFVDPLAGGPVDPDRLFEGVLALERTSWKAAEGHGFAEGPMRAFYAEMVPRLARAGTLRLLVAHVDDAPRGFILGGLRGHGYRGLQFSFSRGFEALSLGNLLQLAQIERLAAEGVATYDLGTDMPYKRAWAEGLVETVPLVVR